MRSTKSMMGDDSIGTAERLGVALGLFPAVVAGVEDVDARSEADIRGRVFGAAERWGLASTRFPKADTGDGTTEVCPGANT